ncbi:MAG TPA: DegT/DnrJ/EryC1/StrS family aminotransferase [Candidatus Latescibacteria bacterium]|nr:DegT/DnrJ/EryC1/StrS family aminotransferase [Candidatus Latescibacterota bacterium]
MLREHPLRTKPFPSRKLYGGEELWELAEALRGQTLFRYTGFKVRAFEEAFARYFGAKYACASTSGTAAIHTAIAMVNPDPGDEIITSPITDMGTVAPILYQNAIPVFADVGDDYNLDPESVEANVTERTRAIIVVHLFGNPARMDELLEVAEKHKLMVIEDCAQAYLAEYKGKLCGTIGHVGCFSLQGSKHIATGDGGMTITDDPELAKRGAMFTDKGWDRSKEGPRVYPFLGLNYRMTELQGAVGLAQLGKLKGVVERRRELAGMLNERLGEIEGITPQPVAEGNRCSYWQYGFTVDRETGVFAEQFAEVLRREGMPADAGYIGKPIFLSQALRDKRTFGRSSHPFDYPGVRQVRYEDGLCPKCEDILNRMVLLPFNEAFSEEDIEDLAMGVRLAAEELF